MNDYYRCIFHLKRLIDVRNILNKMLYGFGFNFEIFDFELINIFYNWKLLSRLCRQSIFFLNFEVHVFKKR